MMHANLVHLISAAYSGALSRLALTEGVFLLLYCS